MDVVKIGRYDQPLRVANHLGMALCLLVNKLHHLWYLVLHV
jgi:hypothetical protein